MNLTQQGPSHRAPSDELIRCGREAWPGIAPGGEFAGRSQVAEMTGPGAWPSGMAHVGSGNLSHLGDATVAHREDRDHADVLLRGVSGGDSHFTGA